MLSSAITVVSPGEKEKRKDRLDDDDEAISNKKQNVIEGGTRYEICKQTVLTRSLQEPINLCGSHPEMFLESLAGNIEIVWCDDGAKEGFVDTFNKAYFNVDTTNAEAVRKASELRQKTGIFVACSRRISRHINKPVMKEGSNGLSYKSTYYVRFAARNNTDKEKEQLICLRAMAQVS
jgi:hypothetical protein